MARCQQCNGSLKAGEKSCFVCGAAVPQANPKSPFRERCRLAIKLAFFASIVLTLASLFTDLTPSFVKCFAAMVILLFVKNSADQMSDASRN
jgi:hypothetical protein